MHGKHCTARVERSGESMKRLTAWLLTSFAIAAWAAAAHSHWRNQQLFQHTAVHKCPIGKGWQLAVDEINARGGLLGRRSKSSLAMMPVARKRHSRHAVELTSNAKVDVLAGIPSNVGLALADHALKNRKPFVASEPLSDALVWDKGNRYTFQLRPSTYMQSAMLVEEAAKMHSQTLGYGGTQLRIRTKRRGQFQGIAWRASTRCRFVAEQWPDARQVDAGSTLRCLTHRGRTPFST